ncbi:hypothetical protein B0T21DRAFT_287372 [Apiosordaria backusii]|uniref:2EXR domain-containing protein n=1 Tax=Apiosordaria backusii TaxID=314023 RepID=A0AA40EG13_9PEZI|nr:hypothetical protein B0T21DRAFT_287372 [Apiosordaria backusii]
MATTFHPFPALPYELRAFIWQFAAAGDPRTVEIRIGWKKQFPSLPHLPFDNSYTSHSYQKSFAQVPFLITGLTPVPALLHTCHESRLLLSTGQKKFYHRACSEIVPGLANLRERFGEIVEYTPEERYVWLNWDIDIVSLGPLPANGKHGTELAALEPVAHLVQRLRYERSYSDEFYVRSEIPQLGMFTSLKEMHIVCSDGYQAWRWASEDHWPCGAGNVIVYDEDVDQVDGRLPKALEGRKSMRLVELDEILGRGSGRGREHWTAGIHWPASIGRVVNRLRDDDRWRGDPVGLSRITG